MWQWNHCLSFNYNFRPAENIRSPLVSSDTYCSWQWLPHGLHELLKLSLGNNLQLLVVMLKEFVFLDDLRVSSSPTLPKEPTWVTIATFLHPIHHEITLKWYNETEWYNGFTLYIQDHNDITLYINYIQTYICSIGTGHKSKKLEQLANSQHHLCFFSPLVFHLCTAGVFVCFCFSCPCWTRV